MKVRLVLPKIIKGYEVGYNGILPPLGLIAIATYLKKNIRNIDVEVLDGDILPWKELESRLKGHVIGINTNFGNYLNAVKIANIAKKKGAKVIFGGPPSPLTNNYKPITRCHH